eukprot:6193969-Pleurochrysis_carterae.AAC.1
MQDVEFTVQEGTLFILQTRNGKRSGAAAVAIAVDMVEQVAEATFDSGGLNVCAAAGGTHQHGGGHSTSDAGAPRYHASQPGERKHHAHRHYRKLDAHVHVRTHITHNLCRSVYELTDLHRLVRACHLSARVDATANMSAPPTSARPSFPLTRETCFLS